MDCRRGPLEFGSSRGLGVTHPHQAPRPTRSARSYYKISQSPHTTFSSFPHPNHLTSTHTQHQTTSRVKRKNGCITLSPSPSIPTNRLRPLLPLSHEHPLLSSSPSTSSPRDPSKLTTFSPVTAFPQQPCPPAQNSPRHTPQPSFEQDFALFAVPRQHPRAHPSHALRQHLTSNLPPTTGAIHAPTFRPNLNVPRQPLPAVPQYPWPANQSQNMVSSEPNVAYDGTSSDLGFGAGAYFKPSADFDKLFGLGPDMFDTSDFTSINNTNTMPATTVSPQELMMASMDSVPSSTAFPDLTPGSDMLETPNTSPLFADTLNTTETWPTLFPDESTDFDAPAMQRHDSTSSQMVVHPGGEPRNHSVVPDASPMSHIARPSTVAGIRKKSKPLPAIVVDEGDPIAVKRARNTAAARKSREKKNAHVETLEARIAELEALVAQQKQEISQLKTTQSSAASTFDGQDFDLSSLL